MPEYECHSLVTAKVVVDAEDAEEAAQKAEQLDADQYEIVAVEEVLPEDCSPVE